MSSKITAVDDTDVEVEPESQKITYNCQGPKHAVDEAEFAELLEEYKGVMAPGDLEALKVDEGQPFSTGAVYHKGRGLCFIRTDSGKEIREFCGADITKLIGAVPADGESHSVTCPKCGNEATVRKIEAPAPADEK